jgi:hypothetical protein
MLTIVMRYTDGQHVLDPATQIAARATIATSPTAPPHVIIVQHRPAAWEHAPGRWWVREDSDGLVATAAPAPYTSYEAALQAVFAAIGHSAMAWLATRPGIPPPAAPLADAAPPLLTPA